jgi:hypothetical protein
MRVCAVKSRLRGCRKPSVAGVDPWAIDERRKSLVTGEFFNNELGEVSALAIDDTAPHALDALAAVSYICHDPSRLRAAHHCYADHFCHNHSVSSGNFLTLGTMLQKNMACFGVALYTARAAPYFAAVPLKDMVRVALMIICWIVRLHGKLCQAAFSVNNLPARTSQDLKHFATMLLFEQHKPKVATQEGVGGGGGGGNAEKVAAKRVERGEESRRRPDGGRRAGERTECYREKRAPHPAGMPNHGSPPPGDPLHRDMLFACARDEVRERQRRAPMPDQAGRDHVKSLVHAREEPVRCEE